MTIKMSGAEFNAFYSDPAMWPEGVYHDDQIITINGVIVDDDCTPNDNDLVSITGGYVTDEDGGDLGTLESYIRKWRKKQNTVVLLVECDMAKVDCVKDAVKVAGGRLKC